MFVFGDGLGWTVGLVGEMFTDLDIRMNGRLDGGEEGREGGGGEGEEIGVC